MRPVSSATRRSRPLPRRARPRPGRRLSELDDLLAGWRHLPPNELEERIRRIQQLAADPKHPQHLGRHVWSAVDKMRAALVFQRKQEARRARRDEEHVRKLARSIKDLQTLPGVIRLGPPA